MKASALNHMSVMADEISPNMSDAADEDLRDVFATLYGEDDWSFDDDVRF